MAIRAKTSHNRSSVCHLHLPLCICDQLPQLKVSTNLTLVMHRNERFKTTNTGKLAAACLSHSKMVIHGDPTCPITEQRLFEPQTQPLYLFPHEHARPLADFLSNSQPITLIVPDGTWRQASKMYKRIPQLRGIPCAKIEETTPSRYVLRRNQREAGVSTMEAIARALGILEGEHVRLEMERVFQIMVDRILWMKGRKSASQVCGGIPEHTSRNPANFSQSLEDLPLKKTSDRNPMP